MYDSASHFFHRYRKIKSNLVRSSPAITLPARVEIPVVKVEVGFDLAVRVVF